MAEVNIRGTSWLQFSRLLELGELVGLPEGDRVRCYEMPEFPVIEEADDDIIYTVARSDRIDVIAERYLGTPELWWVIAVANGLRLIPNEINPQQTLRIPTQNRASQILRKAALRREGR